MRQLIKENQKVFKVKKMTSSVTGFLERFSQKWGPVLRKNRQREQFPKSMKRFSKVALACLPLVVLSAQVVQAQNRTYHNGKIQCNSSWSGGVHEVDLGVIADPSSVSIPLTDVPIDAGCQSWEFYQEKGKQEWRSHGAYCLTVDVTSGSAAYRELKLIGNPSAPSLKFNFAHAGGLSSADAVGNGQGSGVAVPYAAASVGANTVSNGSRLKIGDTNNDLGIYVHPASRQPAGLLSGEYEGTFTWRLYAGTAPSSSSNTINDNAPPPPHTCVERVGNNFQESGTIKIKVKVNVSCSLALPVSGKDIDFGRVTNNEVANGIGPVIHNLEVKCNNKNDMFITIGAGMHSGGDINNRRMKLDGGANLIKYNLIKPGGGEWGDAANSSSGYLVPQTGAVGSTQIIPIEARIPPQSGGFPNGKYKDTVQIQLWN